eukprot:7414594-Pyramimonas_sp.AAC.1
MFLIRSQRSRFPPFWPRGRRSWSPLVGSTVRRIRPRTLRPVCCCQFAFVTRRVCTKRFLRPRRRSVFNGRFAFRSAGGMVSSSRPGAPQSAGSELLLRSYGLTAAWAGVRTPVHA